jgi:multiple sugar transport system permease protein
MDASVTRTKGPAGKAGPFGFLRERSFGLGRPSRQQWLGYLLLLPAILLVALIILWPLLLSIDLSFQRVEMVRVGAARKPWTLANYERLFFSDEFWSSLWVTVKLIVIVTTATFAIGIGTALLINNEFRGRKLARLIVALPWAIPEVVAVLIFAWIFDSSFGLVNWVLIVTGLNDKMINWFSEPGPAFFAVCITMIWKGYPFVSIMVLAGLQAIPEDLFSAARVDGASALRRFIYVTIPILLPVLAVTAILVILWLFRDFSIVYVMTQGGPIKATQTLSIMTYQEAFAFFRMGYASSLGVVTLVLCTIAGVLMVRRHSSSMY